MPRLGSGTIKKLREESQIHVHVELPNETSPYFVERLLQAQLVLNLLPRMFKSVTSVGVDREKLFPKSPAHQKKIKDLAASGKPDVTLVLADQPVESPSGRVIYIDNRGWTAYRSRTAPCPDARGPANALGALYCAALGVSEAFNTILQPHDRRIRLIEDTHRHDLITFLENGAPNFEPRIDQREIWLDDVMIAGLGAVGQALVYALATLPGLRGDIRLIDHEATDATNLTRYLLSFPENTGMLKTDLAGGHLLEGAHLLLRVALNVGQRFRMSQQTEIMPLDNATWSRTRSERFYNPPAEYVAVQEIRNSAPARTVVACVDSAATRRDIQMALPETVLNGWTKTDEHGIVYGVGVHTIRGPWHCLACSHHKRESKDLDEIEFSARITAWPRQKVARYMRTDQRLERGELDEIADRLGLDDQRKLQLRDRPLRDVVHLHCGLAGMAIQGRYETSPVFHVPALVGIHLAAELVARALGGSTKLRNHATFSALIPPNDAGLGHEPKEPGCLCQDPDVQRVYDQSWPASQKEEGVASAEAAPGGAHAEAAASAGGTLESNAPLNHRGPVDAGSEETGWRAPTP